MWILLLLVCLATHHEWTSISGEKYCLRCGTTHRPRHQLSLRLRVSLANRRWVGNRELDEILRGN